MRVRREVAALLASCAVRVISCGVSFAAPTDTVEVTATWAPEPVNIVPTDNTVISGDELRARRATDLASSLALVAGTEVPSDGDSGPAGAVPRFWGLHQFDAFLLVVGAAPWSGAFNPWILTVDLNDVQRLAVMKCAARVMFGASLFVDIIEVIHCPARDPANRVSVGVGDTGPRAAHSLSLALPVVGAYRQALAVDGDLIFQRQVPPGPVELQVAASTTRMPREANYNPADVRVDKTRNHDALRCSRATEAGIWDTTLSFARSDIVDIRGFLRPSLLSDGSSPNTDSRNQNRLIQGSYFDAHVGMKVSGNLSFVQRKDALYCFGKHVSVNGEYHVLRDGKGLAPPKKLHVTEINTVSDTRVFTGQYVQVDWKPAARWDVRAGLRLNETSENKTSAHLDGFDLAANTLDRSKKKRFGPWV